MKMHKLGIVAALAAVSLMVCSTTASAQEARKGNRGPRMNMEQRMEHLSTALNLTDEQKPKVEALFKDMAKKRRDMFSDSSIPRDQRREKMQALMKEENAKMKDILTADQYEKYQKMQAEMRQRRGGGKKKNSQ